MRTANEIRRQFIDFFKKHGHTFVPSSSLLPPPEDESLLFTNAGMNQFKDVFLGIGTRPYKRAVDTQKCIRAGGKHNDLDDVGKDTYHHTFFEMLGNWSFGDYFKKEAIRWAWELLTEVWQLDKSRLHTTVFQGDTAQGLGRDDEAAELWRSETDIDPSHIHWGGKKDNFWEMGDTGPCGPCSEIHYDRTADKSGGKLVNAGTPQVIEIWNLVFIQFNRGADQKLTPLPARHVDTGMGFERIAAVLQNKASNYDTDVFTPIFAAIREVTGAPPYTGKLDDLKDTAYRVISDHIRALTFALTDGAKPGNEKRGYVLRSILRRAERYGRQYLGTKLPFLHELVPTVVQVMREPFPELMTKPDQVAKVIYGEEEQFIRTLDRGIALFEKDVEEATHQFESAKGTQRGPRPVISGAAAFQLHDTYGFFIDIVEQMAAEKGMAVDRPGFDRHMAEAKDRARAGQKKLSVSAITGDLPKTDDSAKYKPGRIEATILGWVEGNTVHRTGEVPCDKQVALLLDRTNFYAEQGGQVGDQGEINADTGSFKVEDTQRLGDTILHIGKCSRLNDSLEAGQTVVLSVDRRRADTMRNHTATHLLHWALRETLGDHVEQRGSKVKPDEFTFDFTNSGPVTPDQMDQVEQLVNEKIYQDLEVNVRELPIEQAKKLGGVRAFFGDKYGDVVRVVEIGDGFSREFCGGTHLKHTGQAGYFMIAREDGVAKGGRRLTCKTGKEAVREVQHETRLLMNMAANLNCRWEDLPKRVEALQEEIKKLQSQLKKDVAGDLNAAADKLLAEAIDVNGAKIIAGELPAAPIDQMRAQVDRLRTKAKSAVVCVGWVEDGKVMLLTGVTDDLTKKVEAGKLIGETAKVVGGKGGGRKDMAQAGGSDTAKLGAALALAKKSAQEKLGG
jgi:alanyl-tRNA synthetase